MRYRFLIIAFLLFPLVPAVAQAFRPAPVDISSEKVRIRGEVFYVHLVVKDQTLYSIARRYGVTVADIEKYNPFLKEQGLKVGSHLQIPVVDNLPPADPQADPEPDHRTLPLEEASSAVPAAPEKKAGHSAASMPAPCAYPVEEADLNRCEAYSYDPVETRFRVALLLPFGTEELARLSPSDSLAETVETPRMRNAMNFVEFYAGVLLAAEDMKEKGLNMELSVFDIYDNKSLNRLLANDQLENMDLVIGPVYADKMEKVLSYTKRHKIPTVSPLDPKVETLLDNQPQLFQVPPPLVCQQTKLLSGIAPGDHVLLVYESGDVEKALVETYKHLLSGQKISLSSFAYSVRKGLMVRDSLVKRLVAGTHNRIFVLSNDEALVTDVTTNLGYINSKQKYTMTLYGQSRWRNFDNMDLSFLHAMNLRLVLPFFVDYKDEDVRKFVQDYRVQFNTEPSQYAFQGYDVSKFFLTALQRYGRGALGDCISLLQVKLLQGNYVFRRNDGHEGYINTGSNLVHYKPDYSIVRQ